MAEYMIYPKNALVHVIPPQVLSTLNFKLFFKKIKKIAWPREFFFKIFNSLDWSVPCLLCRTFGLFIACSRTRKYPGIEFGAMSFVLQSFVLQSFVQKIICPTGLGKLHLSYTSNVYPTHQFFCTSFVLQIIGPIQDLSYTNFFLHIICPKHNLSYT